MLFYSNAFQGIPIKESFTNTLAELREIHADFQVIHAFQADTTERRSAIDILFEHLKEIKQHPREIFGVGEVNAAVWMNKTAFLEQMKVLTAVQA